MAGKRFTVTASTGDVWEITARGFADCAVAIIANPGKYPLPYRKLAVVGIERSDGSARFYVKREDGRNLWPISASRAAVELAMANAE